MGGKHYAQKTLENERRIAASERQAQGHWAQGIFDQLVGSEVMVVTLGRCQVLAVNTDARIVAVRPVAGDQQMYEASFRAVTLLPTRAERARRHPR